MLQHFHTIKLTIWNAFPIRSETKGALIFILITVDFWEVRNLGNDVKCHLQAGGVEWWLAIYPIFFSQDRVFQFILNNDRFEATKPHIVT